MSGNAKWQLWLLWLAGAFGSLSSLPVAQNPMEVFSAAAMTAVTSMGDILSNGAAARYERGINSDFFNVTSKSEVGMGKAINDDRRRRKRHAIPLWAEGALLPLNNAAHPHQHRGKRSPCFTIGGTGGGTGGGQFPNPNPVGDGTDDTDVVGRKRKQRKRNATQRKKARSTSKKTKRKLVSRRRRQAESPGGNLYDETGKKISQTVQEFADAMKSVMGSMISMAQSIHQNVQGSFQDTFSKPKQ